MKKIAKILLAVAIPVALVFLVLFVVKVTKVDAVRSNDTAPVYHVVQGEEIEIGKKDVNPVGKGIYSRKIQACKRQIPGGIRLYLEIGIHNPSASFLR